jgi:hypothetical protein
MPEHIDSEPIGCGSLCVVDDSFQPLVFALRSQLHVQ